MFQSLIKDKNIYSLFFIIKENKYSRLLNSLDFHKILDYYAKCTNHCFCSFYYNIVLKNIAFITFITIFIRQLPYLLKCYNESPKHIYENTLVQV